MLTFPTYNADFCMKLTVQIVSHMVDSKVSIPSYNFDDGR